MSYKNLLPFPRGTTYGQGESGSYDANNPTQYLGAEYEVADTIHKLGGTVTLKVVQNHSTALAVGNTLVEFMTGAGDMGRRVKANANAGAIAFPQDDAMKAAGLSTVPLNDLFYIVVKGPCDIKASTGITTTKLGVGALVQAGGTNSALDEAAAGDSDFIVGVLDEAQTTAGTAKRVIVGSQLAVQAG